MTHSNRNWTSRGACWRVTALLGMVVLGLVSGQRAWAESQSRAQMSTFLSSCAYGTAAGATLGLVSLAFAEDPSNKMNNIARGASLGLYSGIAIGLYLLNSSANKQDVVELKAPRYMVAPIVNAKGLEGGQLLVNLGFF